MKHIHNDNPPPLHETASRPLPNKHHRPLDARNDWDPWVPAREAYPEVHGPLRTMAAILLTFLAFVMVIVLLALWVS